jgi:hypothetical protein
MPKCTSVRAMDGYAGWASEAYVIVLVLDISMFAKGSYLRSFGLFKF